MKPRHPLMSARTVPKGKTPIAIGESENSIWRVSGHILGNAITMRFRAINSDEAIRQAHARGIRVETIELMKPSCAHAPTNI